MLAAFHEYFAALAAGDAASACEHLSAAVHESLAQLAGKQAGGTECTRTLPALLSPDAPQIAREQERGRIARVRVEGDRAFVVFHAPGAKLYQLTMQREDGTWKSTVVAASVLVPSDATLGR